MSSANLTLIIILVVIVLGALWLMGGYNTLVTLRQRCRQAFSDIDIQLKQRRDLVPNLVETVKGYAAHEKTTLEEVVRLRNQAAAAQGPAQQGAAEAQLTGAIGRLMAIAEAYPDLKANANFQQLQTELGDLENKIAAARRFFNNAAAEYNAARESFPTVLIANNFGFGPQEFFTVDEAERKDMADAPKVQF